MIAKSLTILIPTHGRPTLLGRTLGSLAACRLPQGYVETVVVENGSRACVEAVVEEAAEAHPHLRLRYIHVERSSLGSYWPGAQVSRTVRRVRNGAPCFRLWHAKAGRAFARRHGKISKRLPEVKARSAAVFDHSGSLLHLRHREN